MLDAIQTNLTMTAAWRDHISPGDIVSFRFPLPGEEHSGHPKARPCLVLDIEEHGRQRYALLAYGTSSRRRSNVGYEVHVRRRADYLSAGLHEPTRFVGARRLLVPLTHRGFAISKDHGSPVLGRLDGSPFEAMNAVRGRIHAERDIAAEHRMQRHHRRKSVRGQSFTVERRVPRRPLPAGKAVQQ
ncbi:hypothetical protein [Leisingera sp. NJS204]|uniref:hypothetical protein n=1 Tax=Leisingera sp. NJS204 TaxID=2508307 RepID=UPI0010118065|nr:hypothetical protein [Leisingera sp. NJS204]QAX28724.1 hypothetical protein ETW24_04660 [Leisingera sp. NJS204]